MKEPTNGELARQIQSLVIVVKEGFQGVHERQDTTNGKVVRNDEFRIKAETSIAILKWLFGFVGVGNLVLIVKLIAS